MMGRAIKFMSSKDIYTGEYPPFDNNGIGYAVREEDIKGKLKDDKLDCPKSTNKSVNYRQIWTRFCFLANASINDYKSTYELVGDERIKIDVLQDYIEHLDKDNMLPQIKLSAIQMLFDEYVFDIGSELKTRLCHALVAAECGMQQDKIEKTADN